MYVMRLDLAMRRFYYPFPFESIPPFRTRISIYLACWASAVAEAVKISDPSMAEFKTKVKRIGITFGFTYLTLI